MKAHELRNMTVEELLKKDREERENLFRLRFQHGIRRIENPAKLSQLKKNIARIQTILTEKTLSNS